VILPTKSLRWWTALPDSVASIYDGFRDTQHIEWITGHHKYVTDPWQGLVVKVELNRVLEKLMGAVNDESKLAMDDRFGTNTDDWTDINVFETMRLIVAQASSRFTVGLPLCETST
jgi:hypothetical protein